MNAQTDRTGDVSAVSVLDVRDVAVHFGGIKAVDGVSLQLTEGKVFGLLGPNGSGKSTLLAALTRLVDVTRGELLFDGRSYQTCRPAEVPRLGIARTFQTVRLLADLTVRENIALGADLHLVRSGGARRERRAAAGALVDETIERVGLAGLERLRPGELSYGYQRRVEIGRAIALRPRLICLDEPTAGMNRSERAEISQLLMRLRDEGLTALLVEHDVQMMVETCDYLFAMNFGVLIAEGKPESVVREPAVQEAYLGRQWRKHASDN
jgi:branched-chain amino acid transport system ATP-binding protein